MFSITTAYLNILSFSNAQGFLNTVFQYNEKSHADETEAKEEEVSYNEKVVKCPCCKWKGKTSEAKKKFMFLADISEVEIFCPKCNKYITFISDKG